MHAEVSGHPHNGTEAVPVLRSRDVKFGTSPFKHQCCDEASKIAEQEGLVRDAPMFETPDR